MISFCNTPGLINSVACFQCFGNNPLPRRCLAFYWLPPAYIRFLEKSSGKNLHYRIAPFIKPPTKYLFKNITTRRGGRIESMPPVAHLEQDLAKKGSESGHSQLSGHFLGL